MLGYHRDDVFIAGGQPTITYVHREEEHVERTFARAIATPNQIVSLSGPTKTGKTVLCRRILGEREYVWIDGGGVETADDFWRKVVHELNIPVELEREQGSELEFKAEGSIPFITTAGGSRLSKRGSTERHIIDGMSAALAAMLKSKIMLVIDDFHYLEEPVRTTLMRNVKGGVFNGLKVVLLSVTHRVFDAIKAESELTGRFTAISLPHWSEADLRKIPVKGFDALGVDVGIDIVERLCAESQESPFLMQKFCWELCFDAGIETSKIIGKHGLPPEVNLAALFRRISNDAGLPIYQKLAAGPLSRRKRAKRPLQDGSFADIYEATLLALAVTGPTAVVAYDDLRQALNSLLIEQVPQKHEITSALKHLSRISRSSGFASAIDWDEDKREINIVDPYLRFYLRWQVRRDAEPAE